GQFRRPVYLHRVGTSPEGDVLILGHGLPRRAYFSPEVSPDGRWLRLDATWGRDRPRAPGYERWRTLVAEDPDAVLGGSAILDGPDLDRPLLLTVRMRHAISELTLHDLATGAVVAEVPTPG